MVLQAGTWKNQSTFNTFHLVDVTHKTMDTFSIDLVVVLGCLRSSKILMQYFVLPAFLGEKSLQC